MKKSKLIGNGLLVLAIMLAAILSPFQVQSAAENSTQKDNPFPIAFNRATGDGQNFIASNGKGIIMTTSRNYLNITRDYGKTWEARKLPSRQAYFRVHYLDGNFYVATNDYGTYKNVETYYSKDGREWTPFTLQAPDGTPLTIGRVQIVNNQRVLLATRSDLGKTHVFTSTSSDGASWTWQSEIPTQYAFLVYNGKQYSAIDGGYMFYGKPTKKNQFLIDPDMGLSAELSVFTSKDMKQWTKQSGLDEKKTNFRYAVYEEQPVVGNTIHLYDHVSNLLTSVDGITFKLKKNQKILQTNNYRTPVFKKDKTYFVFMQYWHSPGVQKTKVLTSKDKTKWKETKIDSIKNMFVIQSGNKFIGYSYDEVAISDDGFKWKKIK